MKKILFLIGLIPFLAFTQSQDQNYIKTIVYSDTTKTPIASPTILQAKMQIKYFDGLGRPLQTVQYMQSNVSAKSIVTPIEYDEFGRQVKEFLPYVSGAVLTYDSNAVGADTQFYTSPTILTTGNPYFEGTDNPYSQKEIENSPLSRVIKQAAPGDAWSMGNGKEIKFEYLANASNEVRKFKANTTWNVSSGIYGAVLYDDGFYSADKLYKNITKDENWTSGNLHTTEEFKNKEGKVILKRTYNDDGQYNTYYVYDIYGNLSFVIPPMANDIGTISTQVQEDLCYLYRYDSRNRLVEKKLPGKQWEFIVYDKLDRSVLTGPAINPFTGANYGWIFTKYDKFGRVSYTGWSPQTFTSATRHSIQNTYDTTAISSTARGESVLDGVLIDYKESEMPAGLKLLTVSYYDDYTFPGVLQNVPTNIIDQDVAMQVRGLTTGTWIRSLSNAITAVGETATLLYDFKSRVIRNYKVNFLGGSATIDSKYDFTGNVLQQKTTHKRIAQSDGIVVDEEFEYSPQGKLVNHIHTINNGTRELLSHNEYDELGSLIQKNVGGTDTNSYVGLQKVDYRYNIRGWLTDINDVTDLDTDPIQDLFAFKINYNIIEGAVPDIEPLYNGNIAETYWRASSDNVLRKYSYRYDALNRLGDAIYQKPNADIQITGAYNEDMSYDKNGNITHLDRYGNLDDLTIQLPIDNLEYTYTGNRLAKVFDTTHSPLGFANEPFTENFLNDGTDDYAYDDNGNMISDENKGITSISYNHMNLPVEIIFNSNQNTKINYIYNAAGQKLQKIVKSSSTVTRTTDYLDGFQYLNGELLFFPTTEGYVKSTALERGNAYNYVYNYLDHLGNIRLSYGLDPKDGELETLEENHYYPFGLKHTNYNSVLKVYSKEDTGAGVVLKQGVPPESEDPNLPKSLYRYKYQSQELQDELGLNWYSFKWRNYDPAIARFMSIDPLTESYEDYTPYQFASNQPVHAQEVEGMENAHDLNKRILTRESRTIVQDATRTSASVFKGFAANNSTNKYTTAYKGAHRGDTEAAIVDKTKGRAGADGKPVGEPVVRFDKADAKTPNAHINVAGALDHAAIPGGEATLKAISKTADAVNGLNKVAVPVAITLDAIRIGDAMVQDGGIGQNTVETSAKVGGSWGGAWGGSMLGAEFGGGLGLLGGPAAELTVPVGGFVGGIVGGIGGAIGGEAAVGNAINSMKNGHPDNLDKMTIICFVAGTKVTMADYSTVNIENVKNGDLIQTYNTQKNSLEAKEVLLTEISNSDSFVEIQFEDGTTNTNTLTHPYYIEGKGWSSFDYEGAVKKYGITVNKLQESDFAYKINSDRKVVKCKILKIKILHKFEKTYNLSNVKDNHNFFANGILVHNRS